MASVANNETGANAGARAENSLQQVVAYHEPRDDSWWQYTAQRVADIRTRSAKPVYLQEPWKYFGQPWLTANEYLKAPCEAKRSGAAAWTFHTDASAYLNQADWFDRLQPVERDFLERMQGRLAEQQCQP